MDYAAIAAIVIAILTFLSTQWGLRRAADKDYTDLRLKELESCREELAEVRQELAQAKNEVFNLMLRISKLEKGAL